jgi:hypothetical protein
MSGRCWGCCGGVGRSRGGSGAVHFLRYCRSQVSGDDVGEGTEYADMCARKCMNTRYPPGRLQTEDVRADQPEQPACCWARCFITASVVADVRHRMPSREPSITSSRLPPHAVGTDISSNAGSSLHISSMLLAAVVAHQVQVALPQALLAQALGSAGAAGRCTLVVSGAPTPIRLCGRRWQVVPIRNRIPHRSCPAAANSQCSLGRDARLSAAF